MFAYIGTDAGIDFATVAHYELTNGYQNLAQVTVTAPSKGFVVLTGSGYVEILNPASDAWIGISIGKTSGGGAPGKPARCEGVKVSDSDGLTNTGPE